MKKQILAAALLVSSLAVHAETLEVSLNVATEKGAGPAVGTVVVSETPYGLLFTPNLQGVAAGVHGFHIHAKGSCEPKEQDGKIVPAGEAGGHFDPANTGKHLGPYSEDGHLGDLPAIYATADGKVTVPVLAPRLKKISEIKGQTLMLHVGADNYSDQPTVLGGGGARMACGVM